MDALATYHAAVADGVGITLIDGELQLEAAKSKKHWLGKLKPHKAEIIAHLSGVPLSEEPPLEPSKPQSLLEWEAFPLDALPITLRMFARQWAQSIPCDPAAIVLPMLSVVASAIGMSRRLAITETWSEPCIVWTALVADSGSVKSSIMGASVEHLDKREQRFALDYKQALKQFEQRKAEYERELSMFRRNKTEIAPTKPEEPARLHARLDDVTLESLARVFTDNPRGTFLARDELAAWFGAFDKYSSGSGDAPAWLSLYGGRSFSVRRKTGNQSIYIPAAGLSLTGTIQPERMRALATAEHRASGMIARFLLAMPPRLPKRLVASALTAETRDAFDAILNRLFSLEMASERPSTNAYEGAFDEWNERGNLSDVVLEQEETEAQLKPIEIGLTPEAWERFKAFVAMHDEYTRNESGDLQASFAKLEGYVPRLALLFHLVAWAESELSDDLAPVTLDALERSIVVVEWFRHEQERVYTQLGFVNACAYDTKLIDLIRRHGGQMSANELRQNSARFKDNPVGAELALQALVDNRKGEWVPQHKGRYFQLS